LRATGAIRVRRLTTRPLDREVSDRFDGHPTTCFDGRFPARTAFDRIESRSAADVGVVES
jgi:hypothetical protein